MVLTEHALQTAAREKHGAGPAGTGDAGLFPEVQSRPCRHNLRALPTEALFAGQAVGVAAAGAESAVAHQFF